MSKLQKWCIINLNVLLNINKRLHYYTEVMSASSCTQTKPSMHFTHILHFDLLQICSKYAIQILCWGCDNGSRYPEKIHKENFSQLISRIPCLRYFRKNFFGQEYEQTNKIIFRCIYLYHFSLLNF